MGKILYNKGNMVLLKKLDEKTGDSSLYLYKRTKSGKNVFTEKTIPILGLERLKKDQEDLRLLENEEE